MTDLCDCISYNAPQWGGLVPETILPYKRYFPQSERDTVCVDVCIADAMTALWEGGVETGGCCCGHNGQSPIANGRPSVILKHAYDAEDAAMILADDPRQWFIMIWAGSGT